MSKRAFLQKAITLWTFATLPVANLQASPPPSPVNESMSGFAEAIRLEEQLSKESLEWARQKRLLENEIEVLESELSETLRRIESIQSERTEIRERREDLLGQLTEEEELANAVSSLGARLALPTQTLVNLLPRWSLAGDSSAPEITEATPAITLLRLLQEIQAENSRVETKIAEVTDPGSREKYRVDLLAIGLGAGFFASEDGSFAGRFVYDGEDWSPEIILRYADEIHDAIRREKGIVEPGLDDLPFSLEVQ